MKENLHFFHYRWSWVYIIKLLELLKPMSKEV